MTIEELNSLRAEVQANYDHHEKMYMSTWSETCLLELIDADIKRQRCGYSIANSLYLPEDTIYCNPKIAEMVEEALTDYKQKNILRECMLREKQRGCEGK